MRDPWARFYVGRNWETGVGWVLSIMLFPARRLMDWTDEGDRILAALHVEVCATWRVFGRLRPRLRLWVASDADEITMRIAERAGAWP